MFFKPVDERPEDHEDDETDPGPEQQAKDTVAAKPSFLPELYGLGLPSVLGFCMCNACEHAKTYQQQGQKDASSPVVYECLVDAFS